MWAVYITNFVFWVGIAHSGTLISAILFLFRTRWRTAVYRAAETMTIFAVATAGLFPVIHLGRPWFFYWLAPYPNERFLQPDFRSPLIWDFFAISTYLTISALFLVHRPHPGRRQRARDGDRLAQEALHDRRARMAGHRPPVAPLLDGLPAAGGPRDAAGALGAQRGVSWDFAMAQLPGWHSTIFAPYFVAGAIFSGVAMVLTLLIPMRWMHGAGGPDHAVASRQPGEGRFC